ncbi:YchF/TatD family DNA exonuclease [Alteromonas sp. 14N.309.X.WAT.G.H12]|uniref:TatD family hydrolase n=1 Tax=Alteromonas sp. 14N.309.X.WAT.G.H12 TaxID=3120824 RepID=UPI002FD75C88
MFVDSHCHLDRLSDENADLSATLEFARNRGVEHFLCVCVSVEDFHSMKEKVAPFADVSVSCGVHPLHQEDACDYETLLNKAADPCVVAVGETGLDYFYSAETKDIQRISFIDHIKVANVLNKPLIIHTRGARQDTLDLLTHYKKPETKGVLHCFTEDLDMALAAIDLNFYISISGIVTFNSAKSLREVVKALPLDKLLIETDSPWLAPVPHRGKENQPGYVVEVAEFIADLKGISVAELARVTTANFYTLFDHAKPRR